MGIPEQEAGVSAVHKVTASVAKIREANLHRDLFRFIRLPLELVYVTCPLLMEPWMNDRVHEVQLPMIDPHELLDYLHKSGRLNVDPFEIATLVLLSTFCDGLTVSIVYFLGET